MIVAMDDLFVLEVSQMASVRQAMTLLDVSRPTIQKWLDDGKFPNATKEDGKTGEWSIPREDIEVVRQERIDALKQEIAHLQSLANVSYQ